MKCALLYGRRAGIIRYIVLSIILFAQFEICRAADALPAEDIHYAVIEFNTGMFHFKNPTSSMFSGWQRNVNALFHLGFDASHDYFNLQSPDATLSRGGQFTLFTGTSLVVNRAFSITIHDLAHLERARSIGAVNTYIGKSDSGPHISVYEFFFRSFNFTAQPGVSFYTIPNVTPRDVATVTGEGLNLNLMISSLYAKKIFHGEGHVTDFAPYILNKMWSIHYFYDNGVNTDADQYVQNIKLQGFDAIGKKRIIVLAAASMLLSGGTLNVSRSAYDYVFNARSRINEIKFSFGSLSIGWPEFTPGFNPDNVSICPVLDVVYKNNIYVWIGCDVPVFGNTRKNSEPIAGVEIPFGRLTPGLEISYATGGFPFAKGDLSYKVSSLFSIGVSGVYGRGDTMREGRESPRGNEALAYVKISL